MSGQVDISKAHYYLDLMNRAILLLRDHGIKVTPQRIAVVQAALMENRHPTADDIYEKVKDEIPMISKATVYNILNMLVDKGLLKPQILKSGTIVFDPLKEPHHHLIDIDTEEIHNIPWDAIHVTGWNSLHEFQILEYQVIMKGRRK